MTPNELADAVKSIYIGNPLAPTEFLMAIEATLRGQQSQIEIIEKNTDYWADKHSELIKEHRQQQAEIEEWKRKYKDMHNLATQAMSRVHELEKAQQ